MKTLILGGVRSGKSRYAERIALESGLPVTCMVTAQPLDAEMAERIESHRTHRPAEWSVIEEPVHLAGALDRWKDAGGCLIIDCLTLWLTNLLCSGNRELLEQELARFLEIYPGLPGEIVVIGNETNMGVIPADEMSRRYCDLAGTLHQNIAGLSDRVVVTIAGLPQVLKDTPPALD